MPERRFMEEGRALNRDDVNLDMIEIVDGRVS